MDALAEESGGCVGSSSPERLGTSRTVLLSHETGECFITRAGIQLRHGDPPMVVQCITDVYAQSDVHGYRELPRDELVNRFGHDATWTGIDTNDIPVRAGDRVSILALKIVDIAIARPPIERVSIMQAIGTSLQGRPGISNRLSIMWCGDVTRSCIQGMLDLRETRLRHTMSDVVIMTEDPYVQIHIPTARVEEELSAMSKKKQRHPLYSGFALASPRF